MKSTKTGREILRFVRKNGGYIAATYDPTPDGLDGARMDAKENGSRVVAIVRKEKPTHSLDTTSRTFTLTLPPEGEVIEKLRAEVATLEADAREHRIEIKNLMDERDKRAAQITSQYATVAFDMDRNEWVGAQQLVDRLYGEREIMKGTCSGLRNLESRISGVLMDLGVPMGDLADAVKELRDSRQRAYLEVSHLRDQLLSTRATLDLKQDELTKVTAQKDGAYKERDQVVALAVNLAQRCGFEAWLGYHQGVDWEDDWRNIVFIQLPTGQVSWHIHQLEFEAGWFSYVPSPTDLGPKWDGHTTEEKYRRVIEQATKNPWLDRTHSSKRLDAIAGILEPGWKP
jgi:hypothetical protein